MSSPEVDSVDSDDGENSQDSNLNSQELQKRASESVPPRNTRKSMQWALDTYRKWAGRRREVNYIRQDIASYAHDFEALDKTLFKFYGEVHADDGSPFTPSSLQVLRAGLQRHLSEFVEDMPTMAQHPAFRKSNEQFKAAKRRFAMGGNRAAGAAKQPMDPKDQETVRAYFANLRTYEDPTVLQLYVYYMLSMTFGYRGREVWHQLKKDCFVEGRDEFDRPVIRVDQALMEKNYQHTGPNNTCRRINSVSDDPEAEVYLYSTLKLYLSKLDPRQPAFLQKAKTALQLKQQPDSQAWYVNAPMGGNTIDNMMPKISAAAGTSKRYTNHCIRHTLGTNMLRLGYPIAAIQARLRLRSSRTLEWYTGHRTAQELTEETRDVTRPLRGLPPPATACHGSGSSELRCHAGTSSDSSQQQPGPSTSRAINGPPLGMAQQPRTVPMPQGSAARRDVPPPGAAHEQHLMLAAQGSAARRDVPPPGAAHEQQLVPAAQGSSVCRDVPPPGAAQEHNVIPARQEFAGLLPQRVIPLCEADLSRPPPLPVMPVCPAFPAPQKVFYGTFHNCTFN